MEACVFIGEPLSEYGFGRGHPFGQDRMAAFWDEARRRGLDKRMEVLAPASAQRAARERFHTAEYIARVRELSKRGSGCLDQGDPPAFPGVYEAASTVVGSTWYLSRRLCTRRASASDLESSLPATSNTEI